MKKVRSTSLYQETVRCLLNEIVAGERVAGERLPSEREMAEGMGVNRSTVREALRTLELMRLVEKRAGEGVFVADAGREASLEAMVFQHRAGDTLDLQSRYMLFEALQYIEVILAGLAARRRHPQQIGELGRVQENGDAERETSLAYLDRTFHLLIGAMSENPVLARVQNALWIPMTQYMGALYNGSRSFQPWNGEHRSIVIAIQEKKARQAQEKMARHMQHMRRILFPEDGY